MRVNGGVGCDYNVCELGIGRSFPGSGGEKLNWALGRADQDNY